MLTVVFSWSVGGVFAKGFTVGVLMEKGMAKEEIFVAVVVAAVVVAVVVVLYIQS